MLHFSHKFYKNANFKQYFDYLLPTNNIYVLIDTAY